MALPEFQSVERSMARSRRLEPAAALHVAQQQSIAAQTAPHAVAPRQRRDPKHKEKRMGFFSKDIKTMDDLFVHTLRDIYYAEKQIVQSLPEMIEKASEHCAHARSRSRLLESRRAWPGREDTGLRWQ